MPKPPAGKKLGPGPRPKPRALPRKPADDLKKVGRDDGTRGQTGTGVESEISRNPLSREE